MIILFALQAVVFNPNDADQITGDWFSPDMRNSTIQIFRDKDNLYYGKIIDSDKKKWINQTVLKQLSYNSTKASWEGTLYSLEREISINVTINMAASDQLKLVGKKFLITKTFYWEKVVKKE